MYFIEVLNIILHFQRAQGTGLEYDDLRFEILEWRRKYIDVETLLNLQATTMRPVDPDPDLVQKVGEIRKNRTYLLLISGQHTLTYENKYTIQKYNSELKHGSKT